MKKFQIDVEGLNVAFKGAELLQDQKTGNSQSQLWRLDQHLGWALLEQGQLKYTQYTAQVYTEMMAHCGMMAHPYPLDILLIGAADGLMLRQILKHRSVRRVDWVINQPASFEIAKTAFAAQELVDDSRVHFVDDFPLDFLRSAPKPYDLMISDAGLGYNDKLLQTHDYYQALSGLLKAGGGALFNARTSNVLSAKKSNDLRLINEHFALSGQAAFADGSVLGGLQSWIWAGDIDMSQVDVDIINSRLQISPMDCLCYSPLRHQIAFNQDVFIQQAAQTLSNEFAVRS